MSRLTHIETQFNTIIKNNRNNLLETIRLLYDFDEEMCEDWLTDTYYEEESTNTTTYWKHCVRIYLYNPGYLDKGRPDILENTQAWLDYVMVEHTDRQFGYYDRPENFPEQCIYNFDWLSPEEVELAKKIIEIGLAEYK